MNEFYLMITILAASSGGVTDILRQTADNFGWNWKLFLSQVISFSIVAFLLQRFAYKPILALLEERRRKIEEGQLNAEKIKKELAEAEKRYQEILAKANADGQKMIDEAREALLTCPNASNRRRLRQPSRSLPKRVKPARLSMIAQWNL